MEWLFLFGVVLVFVGLFFWIRERRARHRDAERAREEAFLMQLAGVSGAKPSNDETSPSHSAPPHATDPAPGDVHVDAPRVAESTGALSSPPSSPYLDNRHRVVYFWLKTGLPTHEIIPRGSLRRVVGRAQVSKDMLLDFVICDAALAVVAVVDLDRGPEGAAAARFKKELLEAAGVRYACWPASALPDKATLPIWLK